MQPHTRNNPRIRNRASAPGANPILLPKPNHPDTQQHAVLGSAAETSVAIPRIRKATDTLAKRFSIFPRARQRMWAMW